MKAHGHLFGLSDEVIADLAHAFDSVQNVDEVVIFGSRAKGNFSEGSDIDLAAKGGGITLDTILEIKDRIEQLDLLYQVDILDYRSIGDKEVVDHIDRVGKVLWRRLEE